MVQTKKVWMTWLMIAVAVMSFVFNPAQASAAITYSFEVLAKTGTGLTIPGDNMAVLTGLGTGPSINDAGKVAFGASAGVNDTRVLVKGAQFDLNFKINSVFLLGNFLQISNLGHVLMNVLNNDAGQPVYQDTLLVRIDNQNGSNPILAQGTYTLPWPYDMVYAPATLNNLDQGVFYALLKQGGTVFGYENDGVHTNYMPEAQSGLIGGPSDHFPMVSDTGRTVFRRGSPGNYELLLFKDVNFSVAWIFADNVEYLQLGQKPGISDDGRVAVYLGQHKTLGYGLYEASISPSGNFLLFKIAGLPTSIDLNKRVAINHIQGGSGFDYRIVYMSKTSTGALTLNTLDMDVTNPYSPVITNPTLVAQAGKPIAGLGGTVVDISLYDPINNFGQLAFYVQTSTMLGIVRANPSAVADGLQQAPINNALSKGEPIYMHSGQFHHEMTDFVIPGIGMDLDLSHRYLGQTALISQFGFGWNLSYNERLMPQPDGSLELTDGTGRKDVYTFSAGQYIPPAGFYQTLVNNGSGWTITERDGRKRIFDTLGRLSQIKDRNNTTIALTYDPAGRLSIIGPGPTGVRQTIGQDYRITRVTGTNGRQIDFTYNADGLLTQLKDVTTGRLVKYTYDTLNNLTKVTYPTSAQFPAGVTKSFTYDTKHNLLTIKDQKNATIVTNTYDAQNRVIIQKYGTGTYKFVYAPLKTTMTDRKGYVTVYDFNDQGNLIKETRQTKGVRAGDPASFITHYTYNADMEMTSTVYPKGNGVFYTYDSANADARAHGNLLETRQKAVATAPNNDTNDIVVRATYETHFNQVKTAADAKGSVTTNIYDYELNPADPRFAQSGNLVTVNQPAVALGIPTTEFFYNAQGQPVKVIDPNGLVTQMTYFPTTGYLQTVVRDPLGINAVIQFVYDNFGNVSQITDPNTHVSSFVYNELGWLINSTNVLNRKVQYTYDANGNVIKEEKQSNAAGSTWQTTLYTYDVLNHVLTVKDALNRVTTLDYDANDNLDSRKDANLHTTTYVYDERNLLYTAKDANLGVTTYNYDANGFLSSIVDAKTNKTQYIYDGFNRKMKTTYPTAGVFEQYGYDKNSNVTTEITPDNETITYTYDALNRLTNQTYPNAAMNVTRGYDLGSRLTQSTNSFSNIVYGYDNLNRLTNESQTIGAGTFATLSQYDKAGNRTKITYPSGKVVDMTYNAMNQAAGVAVNGVAQAGYAYDPLNRLTQKDLLGGTTKSAVYTYDAVDQLTTLLNQTAPSTLISKHTYTYDKAGNRLTHANQVGATTQTLTLVYDKIDQLLKVTGGQTHTYAYDKVGNRTTADTIAYVANNLNQYTKVAGQTLTYNDNGNLTAEPGVTYAYDPENRLLQVSKPGVTGNYQYDASNRRVKKDVNGAQTYFIYDGDDLIEERSSTGSLIADYVYGLRIDEVLTMTRAGQTYYYFYDGLGSVRQLTNTVGAITESYDYDVFGKPLVASAVGNPWMFTGRQYDEESGNYYYRARYYSPTIGRFLQRDPIGYADGMNLFRYVNNNPLNETDPLGLWGVQFGNFNIGIGNPTYSFGPGSGEYFNDTLAATMDGFIPFIDPFNNQYVSCDEKLQLSKNLGAYSRDTFLSAAATAGLARLGYLKAMNAAKTKHNIDLRWAKRIDLKGRHPKSTGHFNKTTKVRYGYPHVHDPKAPGGVRSPRLLDYIEILFTKI